MFSVGCQFEVICYYTCEIVVSILGPNLNNIDVHAIMGLAINALLPIADITMDVFVGVPNYRNSAPYTILLIAHMHYPKYNTLSG